MSSGAAKSAVARVFNASSVESGNKIKTDVELTDRAQNILLKKEISAAIRFHGENMKAGHNLCKRVEKQLKTLPILTTQKRSDNL
jgi:hypothetical protein